jgi:thiamine biosynthesis lipoprotein
VGAPPEQQGPDFLFQRSAHIMGTSIQLTLWTDDEARAASAARVAFREFERVDLLMSHWRPDSAVGRINAAAGRQPVRVPLEVLTVIERALEVARATDGAFDITVGAFRGLWKFDQDLDGSIPPAAEIERRRQLVNYRDVLVERRRRTVKLRRAGMQITLGGIAKGYAVDRAVTLLHRRGMNDFILQAGGDMYVSGRRGDRPWRVGIRDPRGAREATFAVAEVSDRTFSTSGDYERSFVKDGVRYHHILDPGTGQPARRCRSVTVMARDAFTADAWDTALFILGVERGMKLAESMPDFAAVFVDADNRVHVSSGLRGVLRMVRPPTPGP